MTTVLPTSRAIRQQVLLQRDQNAFLQRYITMGELLSRAVLVDGYTRVDDDTRTLMLLEAADFDAFSELNIERNFFSFTTNAAYLFRFFEELSGEQVDIEALDVADTYGDFAEHIAILRLLLQRYRSLCEAKKILDRIFLPELYRLNREWVAAQEALEVNAEGYLTRFEFSLLREMAGIVPVTLVFDATAYNRKMQERLSEYGIETQAGYRYRINMARMQIDACEALVSQAHIAATPLSERIMQVAFVKQRVFEMIEEGIAPEAIAVVLPDEGFAPYLRLFDEAGNFNFAMGSPLETSRFIRRAEALMRFGEHPGVENRMRLQRHFPEGPDALLKAYSNACDAGCFSDVVDRLLDGEEEAVAAIVREERFYFEQLIPRLGTSTLRALLHLFVNRVRRRSVDDVRGGKVTVMGVLETRACQFDGVVIVDFNEAYVPHKSDKDLFINSSVRARAGLPTTAEREALQKQFYYQLISRAKRVEIAYVSGDTALPSRFLKELDIVSQQQYSDAAWAQILYARRAHRHLEPEPIEGDYDFTKRPLSATALKTFLECRRRFYYRYIEDISPHRLPQEMPEEYEMGNALHNALRDVYSERDHFVDARELKAAVAQALVRHTGSSALERFLEQLWLKKLEPFFENEVRRFSEVRVKACETNLGIPYGSLRLEGRIDRIDHGPEGLEVLDYKSGSYSIYNAKSVEHATDFQLEFYTLLASQNAEVAYSGYYDLSSGTIVRDPFSGRKMELLKVYLEQLSQTTHFTFDLTEEHSRCRYCDYAYLCRREAL